MVGDLKVTLALGASATCSDGQISLSTWGVWDMIEWGGWSVGLVCIGLAYCGFSQCEEMTSSWFCPLSS